MTKIEDLLRDLSCIGMLWEGYLISKDVGKGSIAVLTLEWSSAKQHLINEYTEGPPIDSAGVPVTLDDLGCNVFFRADKGIRSEVCYT